MGGVIGRGEEILEIVPKDSKLIVLARVKTTDIDRVKIGQYADLMFPAFNHEKSSLSIGGESYRGIWPDLFGGIKGNQGNQLLLEGKD